MKEQTIPTIKNNLLLDWIYKQTNNLPVSDLIEFIKSNEKTQKSPKNSKKTQSCRDKVALYRILNNS